jgi:hypothetical protein
MADRDKDLNVQELIVARSGREQREGWADPIPHPERLRSSVDVLRRAVA